MARLSSSMDFLEWALLWLHSAIAFLALFPTTAAFLDVTSVSLSAAFLLLWPNTQIRSILGKRGLSLAYCSRGIKSVMAREAWNRQQEAGPSQFRPHPGSRKKGNRNWEEVIYPQSPPPVTSSTKTAPPKGFMASLNSNTDWGTTQSHEPIRDISHSDYHRGKKSLTPLSIWKGFWDIFHVVRIVGKMFVITSENLWALSILCISLFFQT